MKSKKQFMVTLLIFTFVLPFCGRNAGKSVERGSEVKFKVKTAIVRESSIEKSLNYSGTVQAFRKENVTPKIAGKISKIYVEEGDRVKKGQLLAELDTEQARIQLNQAEAALDAATANFIDAKKNYERAKRLLAEEAISRQQFEKLELAYKAAKANLDKARTAVELARFMINSSMLYASFSGIVTSKLKEEGDFINPGMAGFGGGGGILVLMDFRKILVDVDVPSGKIDVVKKGMPAVVIQGDKRIEGKVYSVAQAADPASKTFKVRVIAENRDLVFKPGTDVDVEIIYFRKKAVAVPISALQDNKYVFVIKNDRVEKREIVTGVVGNRLVEVKKGLVPGERIVVGNLFGLYNGALVEEE